MKKKTPAGRKKKTAAKKTEKKVIQKKKAPARKTYAAKGKRGYSDLEKKAFKRLKAAAALLFVFVLLACACAHTAKEEKEAASPPLPDVGRELETFSLSLPEEGGEKEQAEILGLAFAEGDRSDALSLHQARRFGAGGALETVSKEAEGSMDGISIWTDICKLSDRDKWLDVTLYEHGQDSMGMQVPQREGTQTVIRGNRKDSVISISRVENAPSHIWLRGLVAVPLEEACLKVRIEARCPQERELFVMAFVQAFAGFYGIDQDVMTTDWVQFTERPVKAWTEDGSIYNGSFATFKEPAVTGKNPYKLSVHSSGVSISYSLPEQEDKPIDERLMDDVREIRETYEREYGITDFQQGEVYMTTPGSMVCCQYTYKDKNGALLHGTAAYYPSFTQKVVVCEDPSMPHSSSSYFVYCEALAAAGISMQ